MDIVGEVASWDGVRRDGNEFRFGAAQLGRVYSDGRVEVRFHRRVRDMLVETGRAEPADAPGWVMVSASRPEDAAKAAELFRLAYERARVAQAVRAVRGS